jgi:hypothetical protein
MIVCPALICCEGNVYQTCPNRTFGTVSTEIKMPCDEIEASTDWAEALLTPVWPDFPTHAKSINLVWRAVGWWHDDFLNRDLGGLTTLDAVYVGSDGASLAHELMHVKNPTPENWDHYGWGVGGENAVNHMYRIAIGVDKFGDGLACDPHETMPEAWGVAYYEAGFQYLARDAMACP